MECFRTYANNQLNARIAMRMDLDLNAEIGQVLRPSIRQVLQPRTDPFTYYGICPVIQATK